METDKIRGVGPGLNLHNHGDEVLPEYYKKAYEEAFPKTLPKGPGMIIVYGTGGEDNHWAEEVEEFKWLTPQEYLKASSQLFEFGEVRNTFDISSLRSICKREPTYIDIWKDKLARQYKHNRLIEELLYFSYQYNVTYFRIERLIAKQGALQHEKKQTE